MTDENALEARDVRHLIRGAGTATLASMLVADGGWPYASLVLVAFAHDGSPLLLLSDLAEHAKAIAADSRVSLLFDGTAGHPDRLAGPRVTVLGRAEVSDDATIRDRFLARHPSAAAYAGFGDFRFYAMSVERAHLVAGFGRIRWLDREALCGKSSLSSLPAGAEQGILDHMNADHADAIDLYANVLAGRPGAGWRMTGIDGEGLDLRLAGEVARVPFRQAVRSPDEARVELIRLVGLARAANPVPPRPHC